MKYIDKFKNHFSLLSTSRIQRTGKGNNKKVQFYFTVIFKDQQLFIGLVKSSSNSQDLIDDLVLDVDQLVVDRQFVRDTARLSKMLEDLINLLSIENNLKNDMDVPVMLLLDSVNFSIMQLTIKNTFRGLTTIRNSLLENSKDEVYSMSPFIETDTVFDILSYEGIKDDKVNIQFTSKKYINSWVETLRKTGKKVAYIGSCNIPILLKLMNIEKKGFLLFDIGQSKSKIFDVDNNKNVFEYPFPYGYQQFVRNGNVDGERLIKQFNSRVESEFLSERDDREVIYVSGLTKLENLNANGKRYKCITGLLKKELARCKKNDKISMSRTNFRTICLLTEDLV